MTEQATNDQALTSVRVSNENATSSFKGMDGLTLNPEDPFERVCIEAVSLNRRKRADYAAHNDIFSNFKEAAFFSGLRSAGQSIEALLGTKAARLRQLLWLRPKEVKPNNESERDSLVDRFVYSGISVAAYDAGLYEETSK